MTPAWLMSQGDQREPGIYGPRLRMPRFFDCAGLNKTKSNIFSGHFMSRLAAISICLVTLSCQLLMGQLTASSDDVEALWEGSDASKCILCHRPNQPNDFVRLNEAKLWLDSDKHAIARLRVEPFTALADLRRIYPELPETADRARLIGASNALSRQICQALGYDVAVPAGYQLFREHCLTCHGGDAATRPGVAANERPAPGIGCHSCHQRGANEQWVLRHNDPDPSQWRLQPPAFKAEQGMRDLVSVEEQVTMCADCHIGNFRQQRFVTHAMYAAGHPPLPSFEPETFCRQMPQHWRTAAELYQTLSAATPGQGELYFRLNNPQLFAEPSIPASQMYWQTRKLLLGALIARRHELQLIEDASADPGLWGDYALYDCAACHHALHVVSVLDSNAAILVHPVARGRSNGPSS